LGGPLSKLCPSVPSCIQDGHHYQWMRNCRFSYRTFGLVEPRSFTRPNQLLPGRKKIVIFLIFHCWWLACIVSFTCIKPFSLLLILIRVVFLFHIPMSYETNKEKNGMGTQIFITIYIPNSFIVNILSPREGKRLSNYLLHP
jgi:hypothetical protein